MIVILLLISGLPPDHPSSVRFVAIRLPSLQSLLPSSMSRCLLRPADGA